MALGAAELLLGLLERDVPARLSAAGAMAHPFFSALDWARVLAKVSEKARRVRPEVGPASAFSSCIPTGMHGPCCIFWANLTAFAPRATPRLSPSSRTRTVRAT